jgi:hypothetical protein
MQHEDDERADRPADGFARQAVSERGSAGHGASAARPTNATLR